MLFPLDSCRKTQRLLYGSLRLDGICNVVHLCTHHQGCIVEQSTLNLHLYIVQSDKYCSFFCKGKALAKLVLY